MPIARIRYNTLLWSLKMRVWVDFVEIKHVISVGSWLWNWFSLVAEKVQMLPGRWNLFFLPILQSFYSIPGNFDDPQSVCTPMLVTHRSGWDYFPGLWVSDPERSDLMSGAIYCKSVTIYCEHFRLLSQLRKAGLVMLGYVNLSHF